MGTAPEGPGVIGNRATERRREGGIRESHSPAHWGPGDWAFHPLLLWNLLPPPDVPTCPHTCPLPPDARRETAAFSVAESQVAGVGGHAQPGWKHAVGLGL